MGLSGIAQYLKIIKEKASIVKEEDIVVANNCDCETFNSDYYLGGKGEYPKTLLRAAERFYYHKVLGSLYWGVHYKGKHIVDIKQ